MGAGFVHVNTDVHQCQREGIPSPGAGVIDSCNLLDVSTGNQMPVFCKSIKYSY